MSDVDARELEAYLRLLQTADATINRNNALALKETVDGMVELAQSIEHRQSGFMALSTHQLGPFALGGGVLESQISSAASYVELETDKGGEHDWPQRTIDSSESRLAALGHRTETIVSAAIGDRSNG